MRATVAGRTRRLFVDLRAPPEPYAGMGSGGAVEDPPAGGGWVRMDGDHRRLLRCTPYRQRMIPVHRVGVPMGRTRSLRRRSLSSEWDTTTSPSRTKSRWHCVRRSHRGSRCRSPRVISVSAPLFGGCAELPMTGRVCGRLCRLSSKVRCGRRRPLITLAPYRGGGRIHRRQPVSDRRRAQ